MQELIIFERSVLLSYCILNLTLLPLIQISITSFQNQDVNANRMCKEINVRLKCVYSVRFLVLRPSDNKSDRLVLPVTIYPRIYFYLSLKYYIFWQSIFTPSFNSYLTSYITYTQLGVCAALFKLNVYEQ
jgi:hypothetical protein